MQTCRRVRQGPVRVLKRIERNYRDGDTIFREGEPGQSAYVLVEGTVELVKGDGKEAVTVAVLDPGDVFGEVEAFEESPRRATARAVGPVVAAEVPQGDVLESVGKRSEMALSSVGRLIERLRSAENIAPAQALDPPMMDTQKGVAKPGLLRRLLGWDGAGLGERLDVRVAVVDGSTTDSDVVDQVCAALDDRPGVRVRIIAQPIQRPNALDDLVAAAELTAAARRTLADGGGDVLVSVALPEPRTTLHLRFTSAIAGNEDRPGAIGAATVLLLPIDFGPGLADVLYAMVLAATTLTPSGTAMRLFQLLPPALAAARAAIASPPADLTDREHATVRAAFGDIAARLAQQRGDADLYAEAIDAYRAALRGWPPEAQPLERAFVQKNLGMTLLARSTENNETTAEDGIDALRQALSVIPRQSFPDAWAATQKRLGQALYRLDERSGDAELLKRALAAYQAALQVYTRDAHPHHWAELMHLVAQAAQVLGEQWRNVELLEKAVAACRAALAIRTRRDAPLLWAASENNLGSALFLLGRLTGDLDVLEAAAGAFAQAKAFYAERGSQAMADVADRNLAHVERLVAETATRQTPTLPWEVDDPAIGEASRHGATPSRR